MIILIGNAELALSCAAVETDQIRIEHNYHHTKNLYEPGHITDVACPSLLCQGSKTISLITDISFLNNLLPRSIMANSLLTRFLADNVQADDQAYADDALNDYVEEPPQKKGANAFLLFFFFILLAGIGYYALRSYVFKKRAKLDLAETDGNVGEYKTPQEAGVNV
jgi:hypothetical protein